jgi:hypothetical protein
VLLGPIISIPEGAAVLRAESALKAKLELAPNQRLTQDHRREPVCE